MAFLRLLVAFAGLAVLANGGDYTALDHYVSAPDDSYRYTVARTIPYFGSTIYQLEVVSQNWLSTDVVDRTEWRHWVTIVKPDKLSSSTALLFIDGGSNSATPSLPDTTLASIVLPLGCVLIDVGQVPNQSLQFAGEDKPRSEDSLIAYSWKRFFETGDERWPARLPMTKSAVRAMDAATDFLSKLPTAPVTVKNFIVAGGSKRGWTTWSTAAVDPRVVAIAPMVIDTLNVPAAFQHHYRAYGYWAPAVQDYVDAGVMNHFGTPEMDALMQIEDPYQYRDRLTLPKYLINSTGDQFFLPDSSQFYFNDLPGEKYLRYVPNTDHTLSSAEVPKNLLAWARAITQNFPRPRFYWKADRAKGALRLRVVDKPNKVTLWTASNPKARDFRLETIGPAWTSTEVTGENGIYTAEMPAPEAGYTAFFLELRYPGPDDLELVFTTEVVVTPDVYPFDAPGAPAKEQHEARRSLLR